MTTSPPDVEVIELDDLPDDPPDFTPCEEGGAPDGGERRVLGFAAPVQKPSLWIPKFFDKWGVKYRLIAGWETRGRPASSGGYDPDGALVHHAGARSSATNPHPSLGILVRGRSDLAGPLCQVSTDYNGITSVIAAGRANHAGKARAFGGVPEGDGNRLWLGNEVETDGLQTMPKVQYDAVVLVEVAILDGLGHTPETAARFLGLHNTTSLSGKWDLGAGTGKSGVAFPLRDLARDVVARFAQGPPQQPGTSPSNPNTSQEGPMFSLVELVTKAVFPDPDRNNDPAKKWSMGTYLAATYRNAQAGFKNSTALVQKVDKLGAEVAELRATADAVLGHVANGSGIDLAAIKQAAREGAQSILEVDAEVVVRQRDEDEEAGA